MERVAQCVDLLKLFKLPIKEILKLRLLNKAMNSIIKSNERFWRVAFPTDQENIDTYADYVIDVCHTRHLDRQFKSAQIHATHLANQKSLSKRRRDSRIEKISKLQDELKTEDANLKILEKKHTKKRERLKDLQQQLRDKGFKRPKLRTLRKDTEFKREEWNEQH